MKKLISSMLAIALVTLLVLPSAVLAKQVEDAEKSKNNGKEKGYQSSQMNAKWSRFDVELQGTDGSGKIIKIIDDNPVFDYEVASGNEGLANGDSVVINVRNRGGNIVKQLRYTIDGLEDVVKETEPVHLHSTSLDLDKTFGAVRFLNFNNLAGTAEVYLTDDQEKLGTINRTHIDFYRGTTIDDETPYGDWEERNKVRFGYDSDEGEVWVELNAEYEYRAEYDTLQDADFDTIQFMLLNRQSGSDVRLENIKVNGKKISDTVLIGNSTWPKWNLEGDIQNAHGNFVVEAELVITGNQPSNEYNKVEIMFGKK